MDGWTALSDRLAREIGLIPAIVYARVWRFCRMEDGKCYASLETLAAGLGISRMAVCDTLASLVETGYLTKEESDKSRTPKTYRVTGKFNLSAVLHGDSDREYAKLTDCKPSVQGCTPSVQICTPSVPKKEKETLKKQYTPPSAVSPVKETTGFVSPYTDPHGPVARAAKKLARLEKKTVAKGAEEILANIPINVQLRAVNVCNAYLHGIAMDGNRVITVPPDYVVAHLQDAIAFLDIDTKDIEAAARYYYRSYNGKVSMAKLAIWIHDWLSMGKPEFVPKQDMFLVDPDMKERENLAFREEVDLISKTMQRYEVGRPA